MKAANGIKARTVWLIRHAESASNAGLPTQSTESNPLSTLGREQAKALARHFPAAPDLIVTSRYRRTVETAQPLLERFPDCPTAVWDIHEFTFLSAAKYRGTTEGERRGAVEQYWADCDPLYRDSLDAESFADFLVRVAGLREELRAVPPGFTVIFSHGYLIKALLWRMLFTDETELPALMASFRPVHYYLKVGNAAVFPIQVSEAGEIFVGSPWNPPFESPPPLW